jgi:hypothetical protein
MKPRMKRMRRTASGPADRPGRVAAVHASQAARPVTTRSAGNSPRSSGGGGQPAGSRVKRAESGTAGGGRGVKPALYSRPAARRGAIYRRAYRAAFRKAFREGIALGLRDGGAV